MDIRDTVKLCNLGFSTETVPVQCSRQANLQEAEQIMYIVIHALHKF